MYLLVHLSKLRENQVSRDYKYISLIIYNIVKFDGHASKMISQRSTSGRNRIWENMMMFWL